MSRSLKAGTGVVLALVLAFGVWWLLHRPDPVFASVVDPVTVTIRPPQYAARVEADPKEGVAGLVLVRGNGLVLRFPAGTDGVWLDDGRFVMGSQKRVRCPEGPCFEHTTHVVDLARPGSVPLPGVTGHVELPGEAVHRLNVDFLSYAADLSSHEDLKVPTEPDGGSYLRSLHRRVFSIGEWDYTGFSDGDEESTDEYGYLRRRQGSERWEKVLLGKRLVTLWVSRDGRALLGLQQQYGEPCGGCSKAQQIVEIDPSSGRIAATYGVPGDYDKSWRVADVDKVEDRVVVRYIHRRNNPQNLGVWQYDGDWSLVPGTDKAFTWWQGSQDRIEARATSTDPEADATYRLFWVHGGTSKQLDGELSAYEVAGWRGVPGSLVPLD